MQLPFYIINQICILYYCVKMAAGQKQSMLIVCKTRHEKGKVFAKIVRTNKWKCKNSQAFLCQMWQTADRACWALVCLGRVIICSTHIHHCIIIIICTDHKKIRLMLQCTGQHQWFLKMVWTMNTNDELSIPKSNVQ